MCLRRYGEFHLFQTMRITKVAVQGRGNWYDWVTGYFLLYSQDGQHWIGYSESGDSAHSNVSYYFVAFLNLGVKFGIFIHIQNTMTKSYFIDLLLNKLLHGLSTNVPFLYSRFSLMYIKFHFLSQFIYFSEKKPINLLYHS